MSSLLFVTVYLVSGVCCPIATRVGLKSLKRTTCFYGLLLSMVITKAYA